MQILPGRRTFLNSSLLILSALLSPLFSFAQANANTADGMRANGKIYVVVLVISTIFAGIILFLIYLDRRIKKIEKESSEKK